MNGVAQALAFVVVVVALGFWVWCVVDFLQTDEREMRTFTRPVWVVVLLLGSVAGGALWFALGRPEPTGRR